MEEKELAVREVWVKLMEARLVRDELDKCHRGEGVNHYENCKWLSELYLGKMRDVKASKVVAVQLLYSVYPESCPGNGPRCLRPLH
jgi:hypothetical protein